ncbi:MAG: sensor histidine kinase [Segetibacter sp.]|nr:sensor histidine kinase [Segetibacter sp.]
MMSPNVSILAVVSLLLIIVAGGIINLVLLYRRKQLKYIKDKEQLNISFENKLLQTKLEIQEQTFKTISQEIHDNIGQMLTLVKLNLNLIEIDSPDKIKDKLDDTKQILAQAIQDLRDISKTLNSDTISKAGLNKAIEMEMQVIDRITQLHTNFNCENLPNNLNPQVELILFRIVQEALHNIIKHAKASTISLFVGCNDDHLELLVKDDGIGFDTRTYSSSGTGTGLTNIESRCKLINADFHLNSKIGAGTEIVIRLPIHEKQ